MPLSWPSKTSSTSKKQKNSHHIWPITTLDFLPAQVYSQKPSSYPSQPRQKTFGAETKRTRVTPSPSTGDSGVSSRGTSGSLATAPARRFPEQPDLPGLPKPKAPHVQPPASRSGARRRQRPGQGGCPCPQLLPGAVRRRPQKEGRERT